MIIKLTILIGPRGVYY